MFENGNEIKNAKKRTDHQVCVRSVASSSGKTDGASWKGGKMGHSTSKIPHDRRPFDVIYATFDTKHWSNRYFSRMTP